MKYEITYWTKEGRFEVNFYYPPSRQKLHREHGPAFEKSNGYTAWWVNGERHRLDGPAVIESDGTRRWCVNGERHRLDGPAIEYPGGTREWWINGEWLPGDKIEKWLKENNIDLSTDEGQVAFKLRWS